MKKTILFFVVAIVLLNSCVTVPPLATPEARATETTRPTAVPYTVTPPLVPTLAPVRIVHPTISPPSPTAVPLPSPTPTASPDQSFLPLVGNSVILPAIYTVQGGDTLYQIANDFGVNVYDIARVNNIENIDYVFIGQVLLIPAEPAPPYPAILEGKQIIIVLSTQRVYAFDGSIVVRRFIVSTGLPNTPTVEGEFSIFAKYESTRMIGPDYDLSAVSWTMYFFEGYALHGTYWHSNFGLPMSHGCVNLETSDAKWLYKWAPIGTPVTVLP